jgi:GNAT superfamily N-acetyltransferase
VTPLRIERFAPGNERAFLRLHDDRNHAGWCRCVAWWVPDWDGWSERTAAENLALRHELDRRGRHDGMIAFDGDEPVGWIQVGPRDRLAKLVAQLELTPERDVWAVTCFLVAPAHRRRGVAAALLHAAVDLARASGAARLEGYPRAGAALPDEDAWTGAEATFAAARFETIGSSGARLICSLDLR